MARKMRFRKTKGKGKHLNTNEKKDVKKIIRRIVPLPEEKAVSVTQTALVGVDNNAGEFITLIGPTGGPGANWSVGAQHNQRIGTEIYVKKIEFQWADYIPTLSYGNSYRVIMFVDTQGTETTTMFAVAEGFMNPATAAAGQSILSAYNKDFVGKGKRYHVLSDKIYHNFLMGGGDSDANQRYTCRRISYTFPFKGMKVQLHPSDLALSSAICQTNQVYLWFVRAGPTATAVGTIEEINIDQIRSTVYYTDA